MRLRMPILPRRRGAALACLLGAGLLLWGCGGDGDAGSGGSPDGSGSGAAAPVVRPAPSAEARLERLAERVASGEGISDVTWTRTVQEVGLALWPDSASEEAAQHRRDHTNLAHIAGDMTVQLTLGGLGAREAWLERDPTSVEIHDAFVRAAGQGADAYRSWVETDGRSLLAKRLEAITRSR